MRSPATTRNPYTGRLISGPISDRLQAMMEELQGHTDWYEEDNKTQHTVDLITPPKKQRATLGSTTPASHTPAANPPSIGRALRDKH